MLIIALIRDFYNLSFVRSVIFSVLEQLSGVNVNKNAPPYPAPVGLFVEIALRGCLLSGFILNFCERSVK